MWWILKDVCRVLWLSNSRKVSERLDDDEKGVTLSDTPGGKQSMTVINESGLYGVIIRSDKPNARAFRKWITSHVLPCIRKHGGYVADEVLDKLVENPEEAADFFNALNDERSKRLKLQRQVEVLAPKARYCDVIMGCSDAIPISIIAKDYGMTAAKFNLLLREAEIQYKIRGTWLLRKNFSNMGFTVSKTIYLGNGKTAIHTYWTQRGRRFIYDFLRLCDILPEIER